jgi:hypothetical protein
MTTTAEKFWYGWLKITAILVTIFGIKLALFNQTVLFNFINKPIERIFNFNPEVARLISPLQGWLVGVLGATMAGWGISMLFLIMYPLRKKEMWSWNAIMLSLVVWYLIDTTLSARSGVYLNVVINTIFLIQFLAPLLFLRNTMIKERKK